MKAISIVVPTLNESENVEPLVKRIDDSLSDHKMDYEVIFVDDHSKDGTQAKVKELSKDYNVRLINKKGERGKAQSLLQGFDEAYHDLVCMIDADLQYPPEEIMPMVEELNAKNADVVITERKHNTSLFRRFVSKGFNLVFTRMLFGFNYDTQSGLKIFNKKVLRSFKLNPTPWSFDLEFIVRSLENNFRILNHKIVFSERNAGEAKINVAKASIEVAKASVDLRVNSSRKKVKAGYKRNQEFTRRTYSGSIPVAIVGVVLGALLLMPGSVSAQSRENNGNQRSIVGQIRDLLTPGNNSQRPNTTPQNNQDQNAAIQQQTQAQPPASQTQPTAQPTAPAATTAAPTNVTPTSTAAPAPASPAAAQPIDKTYPNYSSTVQSANYQMPRDRELANNNTPFYIIGGLLAAVVFIGLMIVIKPLNRIKSFRYRASSVRNHA